MNEQTELPTSDQIASLISQAGPSDLGNITRALKRRYAACFPSWEVAFISYRTSPEGRKEDLKTIIYALQQMHDNPNLPNY